MKIVDDNGNRCGANVDGEICTKTKYMFIEYLNDPKTTAASFDNEGFFLTGDIGHFDENGTLHISDRKKNIFKIFYFRVPFSPSQIESYLITLPDVQEVCIVGITTGADEELPAAVIVRNSNSSLNERSYYELVAHEVLGSLIQNTNVKAQRGLLDPKVFCMGNDVFCMGQYETHGDFLTQQFTFHQTTT
ncbi:probable 4-coumarate--CoA ligase 4, partial [Contarinia nasturtii]|uniref:probable 4-coumarate--CoA ligase 4 n=1 Tax=Contarinia nasturtii TaxID=265458 RepID=UPI0012D40B7E